MNSIDSYFLNQEIKILVSSFNSKNLINNIKNYENATKIFIKIYTKG